MAISIETDSSSFAYNNTVTDTFVGFAKAAVFFGIFCCAMKALESYFGPSEPRIYPDFEISESETVESFRDYKEIHLETTKPSNLVEFVTENVLHAEIVLEEKQNEIVSVEKKEEEESCLFTQYVIGAEDDADHINRLIGF